MYEADLKDIVRPASDCVKLTSERSKILASESVKISLKLASVGVCELLRALKKIHIFS